MTARQQLARLLPLAPLVLLLLLVIAGLRGAVLTPRWDGPLKAYGVAIGLAVEVIFGALLFVVFRRGRAAPGADPDVIEPSRALRFTLRYVLFGAMIAVAVALIADLHLHFLGPTKAKPQPLPLPRSTRTPPPAVPKPPGGANLPVSSILWVLLIVVLLVAVAVSIWWSTRLRRPAAARVIADAPADELREAVSEGRAALARVDDARAAIIACYVAMERSLADRGAARAVADTPDELLARAVAAGTVRGAAAGRLTTLFYEARFSTHPLGAGQRDAASAALDELAQELAQEGDREPAGDNA